MTVAAFVLGLFGFGVGVASLTWQIYPFLMQGARPKLTPIVGMVMAGGTMRVTHDATLTNARQSLEIAAKQFSPGPLIVGVKVVNAGRAQFHVAAWAIRADPTGVSFNTLGEQIGSPEVPCDIPAGAEQIFFTRYEGARNLKVGADSIEDKPHRIVVTVSSGGRTFVSKPMAPESLAMKDFA
ncbi:MULTISPECIES: hypothetical protein [unclassified Mycobacterium]|uniref:hypothetical protein n=1 Tax=unclassified Mycobacterium TaxID=2642494 RepID=UPI0007FBFF3F|nr:MULTISPECIES: hypothetical protein [unclassified Mycobacterium]OBG78837.1 hypothetical protein A5700_01205 [Mycobacterium sp. E1214]OBH28305.1 hypothetical protein A5693_22050 [Mycobacterium sp. E1319]